MYLIPDDKYIRTTFFYQTESGMLGLIIIQDSAGKIIRTDELKEAGGDL